MPGMRNTREFLEPIRSRGCSECQPRASKRGHMASQNISFDRALLTRKSPVRNLMISGGESDEQAFPDGISGRAGAGWAARLESGPGPVRSSRPLPIATASMKVWRPMMDLRKKMKFSNEEVFSLKDLIA